MSKLTLRTIVVVVIVAAMAALAYVTVTSLTSFSKEKPARITKWSGGTELVSVTSGRCDHKCRKHGKVKRWRTQTHIGTAFRGNCKQIRTTSQGGNAFDRSIVRFTLSSSWCWRKGKVTRYKPNVSCDTDGWAMWNCAGVQNVIGHCGSGRVHCQRVYRRYYYGFTRHVLQFDQREYTWVAHSLRPRGKYDVDKK